jgi:hypothetical protein
MLLGLALPVLALAEKGTSAEAAFERIVALEGSWVGEVSEESPPGQSEFRLSANGTVMMETMMPGTAHEMINMYHLDGEDLMLTHYCAGGNQPRMRLDLAKATADSLPFVFDGGTNLDPEVDPHIHSLNLRFISENKVEENWSSYNAGQKAGVMKIEMERAE